MDGDTRSKRSDYLISRLSERSADAPPGTDQCDIPTCRRAIRQTCYASILCTDFGCGRDVCVKHLSANCFPILKAGRPIAPCTLCEDRVNKCAWFVILVFAANTILFIAIIIAFCRPKE